MSRPNHRFRISLRTLLVLIGLVAFGLYLFDFKQTRILYGQKTSEFSLGNYEVPTDFDFDQLTNELNSSSWREAFRRRSPQHTRLLESWRPKLHGFTIEKYLGPGNWSLAIIVRSPMYSVRHRKYVWDWPIYRDDFYVSGEEGAARKVGKLNGEFYTLLTSQVTETVEQRSSQE